LWFLEIKYIGKNMATNIATIDLKHGFENVGNWLGITDEKERARIIGLTLSICNFSTRLECNMSLFRIANHCEV